MKLLCVSDHVDPLVYSASVKQRFADVDFVLAAGDLPMEYLGFISASLNKPIYFVFGNHNLRYLSRFRKWGVKRESPKYEIENLRLSQNHFGASYIGASVRRHENIILAGLGGCKRYNKGENQFTEFQMFRQVLSILPALLFNRLFRGRALDILLTHAPPAGLNDRPDPTHQGFRVFRWFIRRFRPKYLLHGHIHLYDLNAVREVIYEQTTIINVYDHYVLDFPSEPQ